MVRSTFFMRVLSLLLATTLAATAADANRLAYLDDDTPFWPSAKSPKFVTPQWIGEEGVDAAVILSIDDLRADVEKWERYVRPVLERLKHIDGRAPFSIFCCKFDPAHPQFQTWLAEGVSLEVHTVDHPCPCLGKMDLARASATTHDGTDLLSQIPGNRPVCFRMPCCDSMNSSSPRFYSEILGGTSAAGRWLSASSSVSMIFTGGENRARFAKYQPKELRPPAKVAFDRYSGDIEDYPYPYLVGQKCIEFPFVVPSDWQGFNALGAKNPQTTGDWKAALDTTVEMRGLMTLVLHPHGWSDPAQIIELIDYSVAKYGKRVKFLNIREALERIEKNAFLGAPLRNPKNGGDSGVRLLDVDGDGYMDVLTGNGDKHITRVWRPKTGRWHEAATPSPLVLPDGDGRQVDTGPRFGILRGEKGATLFTTSHSFNAWTWHDDRWDVSAGLMHGIAGVVQLAEHGKDSGVRMRDFDNDGVCELLLNRDIYGYDAVKGKWERANYALPEGCSVLDAQRRDNGLRFVDLNGDGFDDIFQSNDSGHAIYLWAGKVKDNLGWKRGWPHKVSTGPAAQQPFTDESILPFVKDGKNYGGWFHRGYVVWQNEDTGKLPAFVVRRSFADLIAFDVPPPLTPEESAAAMRPRPGFTVALVAAEPLVVDPVAFDWDASGRLWVVEMRDYPLGMDGKGKPGGVLKRLTDENGDGTFDTAAVFAEGLPFPTGLHQWRNGVIVSAAPDILFLADSDGDGRADVRKVLFTGFTEGNQQHRINGFDWGLDGWLYGANGDSGGRVGAVELPAGGAAPKREPVNISGRDFRFQPDTGEFEPESGATQHGRHRDDWGNWFGNNNPAWLWHYALEDRYIRRNPRLAVKTTKQPLANYADNKRVFTAYPPAAAPIRFNQPQSLGFVTSANSATPYRDTLFGPAFDGSVFISEPVHNAVHREVLAPDGATFTSRRAEDEHDREFVASTDVWFRPTMLKTGPDGALYVADMYRFVLEHPEWIAPETQTRLDLRAGADKGRIWRIAPEGAKLRATPNLAALDNTALAAALDSPNGWQRDTAQRLLIERNARDTAPAIRKLATSAQDAKVRVQALATLATLGVLEAGDVRTALRDSHPRVRENALRCAERLALSSANNRGLLDALLACGDDPEFPVRRQLALTLGEFRDRDGDTVLAALTRLAARDGDSAQMRTAILSSLRPDDALFTELNTAPATAEKIPVLPKPSTADRARVLAAFAPAATLPGDAMRGRDFFLQQCAICHRLKDDGKEVGPDLAMVSDKPADWLLTAIFDPNAAVEPRYQARILRTKSGAELLGIISGETANNVTIRLPGGSELPVLREDIAVDRPAGRSMMPEGIETTLKPQDVADLLAWMRAK